LWTLPLGLRPLRLGSRLCLRLPLRFRSNLRARLRLRLSLRLRLWTRLGPRLRAQHPRVVQVAGGRARVAVRFLRRGEALTHGRIAIRRAAAVVRIMAPAARLLDHGAVDDDRALDAHGVPPPVGAPEEKARADRDRE